MSEDVELEHIAEEIKALAAEGEAQPPSEAPAGAGFDVAAVQNALIGLNLSPANARPAWQPGEWDAQSTGALKEAQLRFGLPPTGNVDPDTLKALGL